MSRTYSGAELKAARRKAGMNQTEFGKLVGLSRHSVSYWECKDVVTVRPFHGTPKRICEALGLPINWTTNARARPWGFRDHQQEALDRQVDAELARIKQRAAEREARRRVKCGAKTRNGTPCRHKSEPGRRRCKFHGGKSTGPRTPEGRARIAEAQRKRWASFRTP